MQQVSTRSPTDQRIADAVRVTPYLPHVIRPHGQLSLMPQESASTSRDRKPQRREKRSRQERQQRALEEPHFNVGAPRTPRRIQPGSPATRTRTNRRPDVSDAGAIPDYPPPSFDEAVAAAAAARSAPPLSPADSITTNSSFSDTYRSAPILIPPVPRSQNQPVVARTIPDPELRDSLRYSTQADYDSDEDLELISTSEATSSTTGSWEDRRVFPERTHLEDGTASTFTRTFRTSPSQLTLTPHLSESPQDDRDDITASSPSTDSQVDDHTIESHNPTPSSVPPRRRLHLLSGLLKSRDHPASAPSTPTHAAASQLSLPIHFLNRPGSPSKPHRGEGLITRKLFGNKGKDKHIEPLIGGLPEPLETWDMLSDVERDAPPTPSSSFVSPVSSISEFFPGASRKASRKSDPALHLLSPGLRREGTRPKHLSMLNPPVPPPTLPLTPTATQRSYTTHMDVHAAASPVSVHRQPTAFAVSATVSASAAVPAPSSPSQGMPVRQAQAPTVVESPTRGRSLRATASMIWHPRKRVSPVRSPTRSTTTPTSPSSVSLQSGVTNDHDTTTPATLVGHDSQGSLPPSLVQEEEEENFVTPPASPARSPSTLPISSRRPSPVRMGVTLRDEGPVAPVSPARSENAHARAARTPTITPRPSINALHAFAPPNPSPLSNQSFERQAFMPPVPPSPTFENMDLHPRRDTVLSVGDTESLIDLYVHSTPAPTTTASELDQQMPASGSGDPMHHHYPGRPLPHPPGASQSGPVRPVLLDAFLGGNNVPGGLPAYEEVELERGGAQGGIWQFLPFSQSSKSSAVNQPGPPRTPPPPPRRAPPPPELFAVFDEDADAAAPEEEDPESPGSTYEMPPSTPSESVHDDEFPDVPDEEDEDDVFTAATTMTRKAPRHLALALPSYFVVDDDDDRQREWGNAGTRSAQTGDAQWAACEARRERGQFRESESAALGMRCQHAFHERCAESWLDRGNRTYPMCRIPF